MSGLHKLPMGWSWATLQDVADIVGGVTKGQKVRPGAQTRQVPYLRVANVQRGFLDLAEVKTIEATEEDIQALRLQPGDILFNEGGDRDKLGRGWVWEGQLPECIHQNHVFRARLLGTEMNPRFISWWGNSFGQEWFMQVGKQSVNLASINLSNLRRFPVPVAPAAEQIRIMETLDELLSDIDAGIETLRLAQAKLKHYRAAVLKAAVEGHLTAEWRKQHPFTKSAAELLKRILGEQRLRNERHSGRRGKSADPAWPNVDALPSLPASWASASIAQLISDPIINGISVRGSDKPPGIASLRLNAMTEGGFDYSARRYLPLRTEEVDDLFIREGDFFVSRANGSKKLVGRGTQAQEPPDDIIFPDTMIRLRFASALRETRWISAIWGSNIIRSQIERAAKTTAGILKISQQDLARLVVPLPPLAEQRAIVAAVDEQLSMIEHVDADTEAKLATAQALRQSILHRAFSGQLVAQDPNDEPAEEILMRIAAERARHSSSTSKRRAKTV